MAGTTYRKLGILANWATEVPGDAFLAFNIAGKNLYAVCGLSAGAWHAYETGLYQPPEKEEWALSAHEPASTAAVRPSDDAAAVMSFNLGTLVADLSAHSEFKNISLPQSSKRPFVSAEAITSLVRSP